MKMIMAIIKPFKLDDIRKVLLNHGIEGLTVSEVKGFGRQKGRTEVDHGDDYHVSYIPKIKIEVTVPNDKVDEIVNAIADEAATGHIGDGKIFVLNVEQAVRIRTGDRDNDAL